MDRGGVESDFREWLCMHYPDQLQTQKRDSARHIPIEAAHSGSTGSVPSTSKTSCDQVARTTSLRDAMTEATRIAEKYKRT